LLRTVHRALFFTFLPDLPSFPDLSPEIGVRVQAIAQAAEPAIASAIEANPPLLSLLQKFEALWGEAFLACAADRRDGFLRALAEGESAPARHLVRVIKSFYLTAIYQGPLAEALTGTRPAPERRPDFAEFVAGIPPLPPSRCRLDPQTREIRCAQTDGSTAIWDYLVIGSGPAGSVVASELAQAGLRVVLVEQGPLLFPGARETKSLAGLLESGGRRLSDDGSLAVVCGEAVGGGTTVNWNLAFPPTLPYIRARLDEWCERGAIAPWADGNRPGLWSPENVARAAAFIARKLDTRTADLTELNEQNRIFWDGAQRLGVEPKLYQLNARQTAADPQAVTVKIAATERFLLPAMQGSASLSVLPQMAVSRITGEESGGRWRADGVEARVMPEWPEGDGIGLQALHGLGLRPGDQVRIRAKQVILAAGALGSPALLLRSGLRDKAPRIGQGLVTHAITTVYGVFPKGRAVRNGEGTAACVFVDDYIRSHNLILETGSFSFSFLASMLYPLPARQVLELFRDYQRLAMVAPVVLENSDLADPLYDSCVYLDERGETQVRFAWRAADRRRLAFGIAQSVRLLLRAGAERVAVPTSEAIGQDAQGYFTSESQADAIERALQLVPNRTALLGAQLQSTNRMGAGPQTSVVGTDHRVHGTENLFVMDASVFPGTVGANPQQSLYTLAKVFAERLLLR
jgi:choline dehydrogenase-like flavoprotein